MKQVIHDNLKFSGITDMNRLPLQFGSYKDMITQLLIKSHHDLMLQEIYRHEILEYTEDNYGMEQTFEYNSYDIDGDNFDW